MRIAARHILTLLILLGSFSGCGKFTMDCRLILRPRIIRVQSSPTDGEEAYMARAYTYYISEKEIDDWAPESYADADAGIIRNKRSGEIRTHDFMGEQNEEDSYIHFDISRTTVFVVVVDPVNKFYAYRDIAIPTAQRTLYVTVRLPLWRSEVEFTELRWTVVNGDPDGMLTDTEWDRRPGIKPPDDNQKADGKESNNE